MAARPTPLSPSGSGRGGRPGGEASSPPGGATLLEQLLALLRQGGVRSLAQVAEKLGTSPALVETMLEDLARRGYLAPVEAQCVRGCAGCPQACSCTVTGAGRVWKMGPKETS